MNLTVKRCLLGLVVSTTMFGSVRAQDGGSVGTVQLGRNAQAPVQALDDGQVQTVSQDPSASQGTVNLPATPAPVFGNNGQMVPPAPIGQPNPSGYGNFYRITPIDQVMTPRLIINSYGGGLYGYNAGYANVGAFIPYKLDQDSILFATGTGMVTYDGRGGGTVGGGWRYYMEDLDRIVGLAAFMDFDNGHNKPYQQMGFSFESLGRYTDYRINGYVPVNQPDHVLYTGLAGTSTLLGSGIGLLRNSTVEQAFSGFDAEIGGPTPLLGRYGLNAYIGGYYYGGMGQNGGNFTGVSGRLLSQINEDVSFGVQVTNDHMFGLNTQFQVFMNLPDGRPGKWMRNLSVRDRMMQNVFRQGRVVAKTESFQTYDAAIDPNSHKPYFVAVIDPNATTNGTGTIGSPFSSIANYQSLTAAQRQQYDLILVRPRNDGTSTNLDTNTAGIGTFDVFNNQRFLSTTVQQTFLTANLPGVALPLGGFTPGASPVLVNSSGGDVVTLVGGNTQTEQVSGFQIQGSGTGNGIHGINNTAVDIDNNLITAGLNGVLLTNMSGTIASGTYGSFLNNTISGNLGNGIQVTNLGSPPAVNPLDVVVYGNTFKNNAGNGLQLDAQGGATIGGIIGGTNTPATATAPAVTLSNIFDSNGGNGASLTANGGTLVFSGTTAVAGSTGTASYGVINNTFTSNGNNGLNISSTNNSIGSFNIIQNTFGAASDSLIITPSNNTLPQTSTHANANFGIGVAADSGNTFLNIGGSTANANSFFSNDYVVNGVVKSPGNSIDVFATGTATINYNINNNILKNTYTLNVPPPVDEFLFTFSGTSGTSPFTLLNESTTSVGPAATITGMTWNLIPSPAVLAPSPDILLPGNNAVVVQPLGDNLLNSVNNIPVIVGTSPLTLVGPGALQANNVNLGLPNYGQTLTLGFNNQFLTGRTFTADSYMLQNDRQTIATATQLQHSTVTVTFSDHSTTTGTVQYTNPVGGVPTVTLDAKTLGPVAPGFGTGSDGIHVAAAGSAQVNTSTIQNNNITGVGGQGIHVTTADSANAPDVLITGNTLQFNGRGSTVNVNSGAINPIFTGGGISVEQNGNAASNLDVLLQNNLVNQNFNNGVTIAVNGAGNSVVNSYTNDISNDSTDPTKTTGNGANGLYITSTGSGTLTFNSTNDILNGNGVGAGVNPASTGGDNILVAVGGTATINTNFYGVQANNASGNGLAASSSDGSTLNLVVDNSSTKQSSFTANGLNGIHLTGNNTSLLHAGISNTNMNSNNGNGIEIDRNGASLMLVNITNSTMNSNLGNGLKFLGIGSDSTDPTQQLSGQPNLINLTNDQLNLNGINGALVNAYGQSDILMNALSTTFNNNQANGLRVDETPGAAFGSPSTNQMSTFDNVSFANNGANGLFFSSQISGSPLGDAQSRTFFMLNSVHGNSTISNNGGDGLLTQYSGGTHDLFIQGDGNATPVYQTAVQANTLDGIHADIGNFATATINIDTILVGGSTTALGNKGDGISLDVVMNTQLPPNFVFHTGGSGGIVTSAQYVFDFLKAGTGTLNVNNSLIQNNGGNGILLYGNSLAGTGFGATSYLARTTESGGYFSEEGYGQLNANITNNHIINNGWNQANVVNGTSQTTEVNGDGIKIELLGNFGGDRWGYDGGTPGYNVIKLSNNVISNNQNYGVFFEANPGLMKSFVSWGFFSPPDPPGSQNVPLNPLDMANSGYAFGNFPWNYNGTYFGQNIGILDANLLSNWLGLDTVSNSQLTMTNNTIQGNGQAHDLNNADAVKFRIGTGAYLAADLQGNNLTGNVGSSFRTESFVQYNPIDGTTYKTIASTKGSGTTDSFVNLDPTAQMDLRFINNVGNTVNIVNPLTNVAGQSLGNTSGNGAVFDPHNTSDPLKDPISTKDPLFVRLTQLFQVDNGNNLDTTNSFISNGVIQPLSSQFYNGDFYLNPIAAPIFPNPWPNFPSSATTSPGNPFAN